MTIGQTSCFPKKTLAIRTPERGDIYVVDPGPTVGSEQRGRRPYLVASIDAMNSAPAELVIVMPLTTTKWPNPLHVRIDPAESSLPRVSYAMPELAKSVSTLRLRRHMGRVPLATVDRVTRNTGFLLGLGRIKF
jgi:mRNA interferase MazF